MIMGKKGKTYRGQRKRYNPCGCFYCTCTDKEHRGLIEEKRIDKETGEIINMWIRTVSGVVFVEAVQTAQGFWIPKTGRQNPFF